MTFSIVILGAPRTKKTSNRLAWRYSRRLGKKVRIVLPSQAWERWATSAGIILLDPDGKAVMRDGRRGRILLGLAPLTTARVRCAAVFYRDANRGDAVGFYQGVADLLEKRGVLANDKQIVDWAGSELRKDTKHPRTELTLHVLES